MGDSGTCLMHAFSYASGINQAQQGNPMNALGESISFGRFMSESLSWEKWSTFSHNRYVEEAERYAKPGSVAQKKAFFEAHYKRIAAQKAAALLEQANAVNDATEPQPETGVGDSSPSDSKAMPLNSHEAVVEQAEPEVNTQHAKINFLVKTDDGKNLDTKSVEPVAGEVEGAYLVAQQEVVPMETPAKKVSRADDVENQDMNSGSELSGTPQMEKPLLKNSSDAQDVSSVKSKKNSAFSSLKSSVYRKTSKVPFSPAKPITPHVKKENHAIPSTKKSIVDLTEKKTSTPKSLQTLVNSTPAKEPDKLIATATRKKENPKVIAMSYKGSQDCATPLRTPKKASSAWMSKHASATPRSENTRSKSPNDGSKTTVPKWHILSAVYSKSLTACHNKLQSPTLSTPFILRTEERAASRKQKLEEKFNSKEIQKVQLQTKLKEKAGSELRKLRQSFCFKARPLPDFYKEREATKIQTKKSTVTQPQSPKLGRKPSASTRLHHSDSIYFMQEKEGSEFRKLRQSFCFKARPLPNFYKEREATKIQTKKSTVTRPQSPKLGRKPSSSTISLPPSISMYKSSNIPKHVYPTKMVKPPMTFLLQCQK